MEKAGDVEAKAKLQLLFYVWEINFKCPKDYRPLVKKDKKDTNGEYRNDVSSKDKEETKSYNLLLLISLRPRLPRSVNKTDKETF